MQKKLALFIFWLCFLTPLHADDSKVVRLVVPFSAGSAQDIFARTISDRLGQELNAHISVINKPGAGGTIGAAFVAQARPDGKTLLLASSSHHLAGVLYPNLSYHPLNSFQAAAFCGTSSYVLLVSEKLKVLDISSFVDRVRSSPNTFNYASSGTGSVTHLGMASFLKRADLQMVHLPLNGTNEIIREILSGSVHAAMLPALSIQGYLGEPRIRLLATADNKPSAPFPNLPTVSSSGYPDFFWQSWVGLLLPSGTSEAKTQAISRAMHRVIAAPDMQQRFEKLGIYPRGMPLPQFSELLHNDWAQSSAVVNALSLN